jgi:hypothetical protein
VGSYTELVLGDAGQLDAEVVVDVHGEPGAVPARRCLPAVQVRRAEEAFGVCNDSEAWCRIRPGRDDVGAFVDCRVLVHLAGTRGLEQAPRLLELQLIPVLELLCRLLDGGNPRAPGGVVAPEQAVAFADPFLPDRDRVVDEPAELQLGAVVVVRVEVAPDRLPHLEVAERVGVAMVKVAQARLDECRHDRQLARKTRLVCLTGHPARDNFPRRVVAGVDVASVGKHVRLGLRASEAPGRARGIARRRVELPTRARPAHRGELQGASALSRPGRVIREQHLVDAAVPSRRGGALRHLEPRLVVCLTGRIRARGRG